MSLQTTLAAIVGPDINAMQLYDQAPWRLVLEDMHRMYIIPLSCQKGVAQPYPHVALTNLLALEDMLVELLLKSLIGQVDAQLLKAVFFEALKSIDVQDAYAAVALRPLACTCHMLHHSPVLVRFTYACHAMSRHIGQ